MRRVVMAVLEAEQSDWLKELNAWTQIRNKDGAVFACIKPTISLQVLVRRGNELNAKDGGIISINKSWLPPHFEICNNKGVRGMYQLNRLFIYQNDAGLSVDYDCGALCGQGSYFSLRRVHGEWKVTDEQTLWMS